MKVQSEKGGHTSKWSLETTGAIDRSVAALIALAVAVIAHVLGIDSDLLHLIASSNL
jgi:hypothetical protein